MTVSGTWVPAGPSRNAVGAGQGGEALAVHAAAASHAARSSRSRLRVEPAGRHRDADVLRAGRLALRPFERRAHGVLERTEAQPGGDRLRRVHPEERGPVRIDGRREPERQVLERLDALLVEPALVGPDELGIAAHALEELAERERLRRADRVEDSRETVLGRAEDPFGQVARVDPLHRLGAWLRRERRPALGEPCHPVREAVRRVVRPDDQPGAHRERPLGESALAEHLEAAVGLGRAEPLGLVGRKLDHTRVLGPSADALVRVDRAAGDERVVADPPGERLGRRAHLAREVRRRVHDRIPLAGAQGGEIAVAVAAQALDVGEELGAVLSAREDRDLVPGLERGLDDVTADEDRASQDEHSHPRDPIVRPVSAVPEVLAPDLRLVFCGINPGRASASAGAHYANPRNDFWRLLHDAGFTPRLYDPSEQHDLLGARDRAHERRVSHDPRLERPARGRLRRIGRAARGAGPGSAPRRHRVRGQGGLPGSLPRAPRSRPPGTDPRRHAALRAALHVTRERGRPVRGAAALV